MACKLDRHPRRHEIDQLLVNGTPIRTICATFNVTVGTVHRHKTCIKELLSQAMRTDQGERAERGSALYDRVEKLVAAAEEILVAAKAKNDFRGANGALGAAAKLLDLLGRVSGELQSANACGIHLTKITNVNVTSYGDDQEIAELVREATDNWNPGVIEHLKALTADQ